MITKEVGKLLKVGFIQEIKCATWLSNVFMVKKKSVKWHMCVYFTNLNKSYSKDPCPLPQIDRLVDVASRFRFLSFMDAYSVYNQIRMNLTDAPKMAFMNDRKNY